MRALKGLKVKFMDLEAECTALFDSGSAITAIQGSFFEESFGPRWLKLSRPLRLFWINGESITAGKYAQVSIIMDGFEIPEIVFIVDDFVEQVEVEGRSIKLPELIVGSGTMDRYGIILDPKEGVKLTGATLLL
jgi:hypothetical protein